MDQIKGRVCVTGASGYLASWLVKRLLLSGYHVTGTVRDPENEKKVAHLWRLEGAKERLRLVKADLMEEGSFDDAIMECRGVFHTASPVLKPSSDPKAEILEPAIEGTLNVLRSCKRSPSLKRVILTSSSSTLRVRDDFDSNIPLDESSWSSVELCERLQIWYALSKTLAEKAAWEFCNGNGIDLITVLPSFVIGPSLSPDLSSTTSDVLGLLTDAECIKNSASNPKLDAISGGLLHPKLAGKLRFMDYLDEEQRRAITMKSSSIALRYKDYPINLIDPPGHMDFCSEVSTAARLSGGALVLVDAVEGMHIQKHAVLRQAWIEKLTPCLVLNKIDRVICELKLSPMEAYNRLLKIVHEVNGIMSAYKSEVFVRFGFYTCWTSW
ncbi:hypothetical protein NC653_021253 [Populus alba x Populus x berolinensis]|uniref:Tr-type G domain-containing protein n=1 Tax=Populus alba x Populus x berolinensis TaxID=444605 RepID=A0AAD6MMH4_9ROSI|nr:hypothetical protein NC653_021253 [Populus alba x Populus x berolinensis]